MDFDIAGIQTKGLIDSGASLSILSPTLFEKLKTVNLKIFYLSRSVKIHTLDNHVIPFKSCIKIRFRLNGIFVTAIFYVLMHDFNKNYNVILGYDFLKNNKMILDCETKSLKFKNTKIPLYLGNKTDTTNEQMNTIYNIHVKQNSKIDGSQNYQQSLIKNDQLNLSNAQYGLFKPQKSYLKCSEIDRQSNSENSNSISSSIHNQNKIHEEQSSSTNIINNLQNITTFDQNKFEIDQNMSSHNIKTKINDNIPVARLINKINLQPLESSIVKIKCPKTVQTNQTVFMEPFKQKSGIMIDCSVNSLDHNNHAIITIKNNNNFPVTLNKNMKIAKIFTDFLIADNLNTHKNSHIINNINASDMAELRRKDLKVQDFDLNHLDKALQQKVINLLFKNAAAFSKNYLTMGQTSRVSPTFNLLHNYPIANKPYKMPHDVKKYAKEEIDKLLEANIIEPSSSRYAFPVVFVKKKSTSKTNNPEHIKYRMACDYRLLNEILDPLPYPIPDIKEILQSISGKKYYTVLDFNSAFFQINLKPEDKDKLSFITEFGVYRPNRVMFGTKLSTQIFAQLIDLIFKDVDKSKIRFFIDDIIIASESIEEMLQLLQQVLSILTENNLTLDPRKMQILKTEIDFLGFKINQHGYSPSEKNLHKVKNLVRPKNKKGVQQLLGFTNYFKHLINSYSNTVAPLIELTKKNVRFTWDDIHEAAFKKIQQDILDNPTVKPPNFNKDFYIITDASHVAISGILAQKYGDNLFPIEFYARKLNNAERKYQTLKLELLAIHDTIKHFRNIILGRKIILLTDSKAITQSIELQKQPEIVARWLNFLQDFDIRYEHIPGISNPADYFSRQINTMEITNPIDDLFQVNKDLSIQNIIQEQHKDEKLGKIISDIQKGKSNKTLRKFQLLDNQLLILRQSPTNSNTQLIIAPKILQETIFHAAHKNHFGFEKTYDLIKKHFFWHRMYIDIKRLCANCIKCNRNKPRKVTKVPIQTPNKDFKVSECLHIDLVGKLPLSLKKNAYILTIIDSFSRHFHAEPLPNIDTSTILNTLNKYFSIFGLPSQIHADNQSIFRSKRFGEYMQKLNIKLHFSSIYLPRSNGLIEATHKSLKSSLISLCNKTFQWDDALYFYTLHYNTSRHRATKFTPAFLYFARELRIPFTTQLMQLDVLDETIDDYVKNRVQLMQTVYKQALNNQNEIMQEYNKNRLTIPKHTFQLGDHVYLKKFIKPKAMESKNKGPFEILKKFRNNNFLIKEEGCKPIKVHISHLFKPKYANA